MSWLGLGEASSKLSSVLIVFVCAIAVSWTVGEAQGHNDAYDYMSNEFGAYQQEIAKRDAALIEAKMEVAEWRGMVDRMLSVPGETVFDCLEVVD